MGKYDIPTAVDYILKETKTEKLYYIGHSMGTTMFWVALNENPSLKEKIALMIGMGPVAKVQYMISPLRFLAPFIHEAEVSCYVTRIFINCRLKRNILASLTVTLRNAYL